MTRIGQPHPSAPADPVARRLGVEADRKGNADGVASRAELDGLARSMQVKPGAAWDVDAAQRAATAKTLAAETKSVATLDPELRAMPPALRRLALELDGIWGNADGKVTPAEVDRVARYYLSALPFFSADARSLLELAQYLKLDVAAAPVRNVVDLRAALSRVDRKEETAAKPFRALFDEAVAQAEVPGAPELLRDTLRHSPRWHRLSILEHSAVAVDAARELSARAGVDWKAAGATMLLHDVGKILERQVRDGAHFTFWDHEELGAQWLQDKGVDAEMFFLIQNHSVLRELTVDELEARCGGDRTRMARLAVVYVADQVAKGDTPDQLQSLAQQEPKIREFARRAGVDADALFRGAAQLRARWFPGAPPS
ncbi:MAG: HDIG domain-containing protein [Deltaproteobacteria bacterium]|nr:HDIG domain-containing protein [Deltaproteobacteria bacterium]